MSNMKIRNQIKKLMRNNGFSLIREKSHYIWKHSTGAIITTSKTPSGNYAIAQCNRQIKKVLAV
tara:strand:- start:185 stop:376 length:192 start_codon:yes stop_codon:yes gene_type:complete